MRPSHGPVAIGHRLIEILDNWFLFFVKGKT